MNFRCTLAVPKQNLYHGLDRLEIGKGSYRFFGPFYGKYYLVVLDAYSKWLEVKIMNNITTDNTISQLREIFRRWRLPFTLVSDNGSQLTSREFQHFIKLNGIKHLKTAPGHPASNGAAENSVKTIKHALSTALTDGINKGIHVFTLLNRFLLSYRNAPHSTTGESPALLMLGRLLRCRLDILHSSVDEAVKDIQEKQILGYKGKSIRTFKEGNCVMIKFYHLGGKESWIKTKIIRILGTERYECVSGDKIYIRHVD